MRRILMLICIVAIVALALPPPVTAMTMDEMLIAENIAIATPATDLETAIAPEIIGTPPLNEDPIDLRAIIAADSASSLWRSTRGHNSKAATRVNSYYRSTDTGFDDCVDNTANCAGFNLRR